MTTLPSATVPDVDSLYVMQAAVREALPRMLHDPQLRWRICYPDWVFLFDRREGIARITPEGTYLLFDIPVDLVNPDPGAWPQLVVINDRRNGGRAL